MSRNTPPKEVFGQTGERAAEFSRGVHLAEKKGKRKKKADTSEVANQTGRHLWRKIGPTAGNAGLPRGRGGKTRNEI